MANNRQDGTERFCVRGPITPTKHARLQDYSDALGDGLAGWRVAVCLRDPVARAVSYYFSPHRWLRPDGQGGWRVRRPEWDLDAFLALLPDVAPMADFVIVDGTVRRPDYMIRQERLSEDFGAFVRATGLPVDPATLPQVNRSARDPELRAAAMADPAVRAAVRDRFAQDYALIEAWTRAPIREAAFS